MPVDVFDFNAVPGPENIVGVYGIPNTTEAKEIRQIAERKGGPLRDVVAFEDVFEEDLERRCPTSVRAVCVFYLQRHAKRFRAWLRRGGKDGWWASKKSPAWTGQERIGALASSQRRASICLALLASSPVLLSVNKPTSTLRLNYTSWPTRFSGLIDGATSSVSNSPAQGST